MLQNVYYFQTDFVLFIPFIFLIWLLVVGLFPIFSYLLLQSNKKQFLSKVHPYYYTSIFLTNGGSLEELFKNPNLSRRLISFDFEAMGCSYLNVTRVFIFFVLLLHYKQITIIGDCVWPIYYGLTFSFNPFGCLILVVYFFVISLYWRFQLAFSFVEYFLYHFLVVVLFIIFATSDFLVLYFFMELFSIITYILVSLGGSLDDRGNEVSFKYAFFGAIASCFFITGMCFYYYSCGNLLFNHNIFNYSDINDFILPRVSLLLFFVGLFIKLGVFPFHGWLLDVYMGVSDYVLIFLVAIVKLVFCLIFLKIYLAFEMFDSFYNYCILFGIPTSIVGISGSIYQSKFRPLIAYSSINFVGTFLIIISAMHQINVVFVFLYLIIYTTILLFMLFTFFYVNRNRFVIFHLNELKSAFYYTPVAIGFLLTNIFVLVTMPPAVNFSMKFVLLYNLFTFGDFFVIFLFVFWGIFSAYYYFKILKPVFGYKIVFMNRNRPDLNKYTTITFSDILFAFFIFLIFMFIILYPMEEFLTILMSF